MIDWNLAIDTIVTGLIVISLFVFAYLMVKE